MELETHKEKRYKLLFELNKRYIFLNIIIVVEAVGLVVILAPPDKTSPSYDPYLASGCVLIACGILLLIAVLWVAHKGATTDKKYILQAVITDDRRKGLRRKKTEDDERFSEEKKEDTSILDENQAAREIKEEPTPDTQPTTAQELKKGEDFCFHLPQDHIDEQAGPSNQGIDRLSQLAKDAPFIDE